jgi:hypothetical protein
VAASSRGDSVEEQRLISAAARKAFTVPDYWGLSEGLDDLLKLYLLEQLDLATVYWRLSAYLDRVSQCRPHGPDDERQEQRWQLLRMLDYRCVVLADAWQLLCNELHLDPDVLAQDLPGYAAVQQVVQAARFVAFNAEEALDYLRHYFEASQPPSNATPPLPRKYQLDSATDMAQQMRGFLQARLESWQ